MIQIAKTIAEIRKYVAQARMAGKTVGFVPTMGALHAGHVSLIEAAVRRCNYVVVSIFVNPTQFGPGEDFEKYPRPFEKDAQICERCGTHAIFAPSSEEMYPRKNLTWVTVEKLTEPLCGRSRPGHFRGVTTVCTKLFHIVGADVAFFGQKDAQQATVIRRMVADLNMLNSYTGLTLPLMSYGGSGVLVNCVAIAVLLRVDYENRQLMRGAA